MPPEMNSLHSKYNVRQARYQFNTNKQYFAWVVATKQLEMPGVKEFVRAIKVTLATPYCFDGDDLCPSEMQEAVIWVVRRDNNSDEVDEPTEFLNDAGVVCDGDEVRPPDPPFPFLKCLLGEPEGENQYQRIADWEVIPPGKYPIRPVVVGTRKLSGLILDDATFKVTCGTNAPVSIGPVLFSLLQALDAAYPSRASLKILRFKVEGWHPDTSDHTISQSIYDLSLKLKPFGYEISKRLGEKGWKLLLMNSDKV